MEITISLSLPLSIRALSAPPIEIGIFARAHGRILRRFVETILSPGFLHGQARTRNFVTRGSSPRARARALVVSFISPRFGSPAINLEIVPTSYRYLRLSLLPAVCWPREGYARTPRAGKFSVRSISRASTSSTF